MLQGMEYKSMEFLVDHLGSKSHPVKICLVVWKFEYELEHTQTGPLLKLCTNK
jgi:hypothetical protein